MILEKTSSKSYTTFFFFPHRAISLNCSLPLALFKKVFAFLSRVAHITKTHKASCLQRRKKHQTQKYVVTSEALHPLSPQQIQEKHTPTSIDKLTSQQNKNGSKINKKTWLRTVPIVYQISRSMMVGYKGLILKNDRLNKQIKVPPLRPKK